MTRLRTKKRNRKDIKDLVQNSQELFEYLLHVCDILVDPPSHGCHEREIDGFKSDLVATLKKLDTNTSKIVGHLAYEEVKHEAFATTFKLDQFYDYHVFLKNAPKHK